MTSLWAYPERSRWKTAQSLRKQAFHLASAFRRGAAALGTALRAVAGTLAAGCRLNKRKKDPGTFQLLLALDDGGFA